MIENLLLDPDSIWEAIQSIVERTTLRTVDAIAAALDMIIDAATEEEIERRILAEIGPSHFWPKTPMLQVPQQAASFIQEIQSLYSEANLEAVRTSVAAAVNKIRESQRRREEFHGKEVLDAFYKQYLASTGLSKVVFVFETARHARRRKSVTAYFDALFEQMGIKISTESISPSVA
jgi:hypothetical protein